MQSELSRASGTDHHAVRFESVGHAYYHMVTLSLADLQAYTHANLMCVWARPSKLGWHDVRRFE